MNPMNNTITMNLLYGNNEEQRKPFLLNKNDTKKQTRSKRIGLGKYSRGDATNDDSTNNSEDDDLSYSNVMTMTGLNTTEEESSFSSTPRRISFTKQDEVDGIEQSLLPPLDTTNEKPKKTVRFAPELMKATESVGINSTSSATKPWEGTLTEDHCRELWYQKDELVAIKHAAKVIIANSVFLENNPDTSSEDQDGLIGLERFSKKRAVWKRTAIRCVLEAQRQMTELAKTIHNDYFHDISKEDYIHSISMRCTAWSRDAAKKQGFRDYCAAHDPLASLFSDGGHGEMTLEDYGKENEQNYDEMIFGERDTSGIGEKRSCEQVNDDFQQQQESRNVRQRV